MSGCGGGGLGRETAKVFLLYKIELWLSRRLGSRECRPGWQAASEESECARVCVFLCGSIVSCIPTYLPT